MDIYPQHTNIAQGNSATVDKKLLLSADFLLSKGFKLVSVEDNPFLDLNMPYYVREGVMLFFNTPVTEWNENAFYVGYGEMRCGKYHAVAFRWIKEQKDIIEIYKAVTGKDIDSVLDNKPEK